MGGPKTKRGRRRGNVEELPNGNLRVRVYAGTDPVTKRAHYLREIVPAGPKADREAEKVLTRLLNEVDEQRNPRTSAPVKQLLKRYLDHYFEGEPSTRDQYRSYVRNHIAPFIGDEPVGRIDADILDSLYAELRRCRDHCTTGRRIDHRTRSKHECDARCRPHECKPLGPTAIRQIHYLLSGAYKRAKRWGWVAKNPTEDVDPPASPPADPSPPSAEESAKILNEAWQDEDWGCLLWLAMTTGARRGELCALRWSDFDASAAVLSLKRAIARDPERRVWFEKDTKTHQQRRVALDPVTVELLNEHRERCSSRAAAIDVDFTSSGFIFSHAPDASEFQKPSSVTQRYDRMVDRLGINTTLHKLRHYSATELISAGVDVRTVAGRLGHGSGGQTTLRVYTAWVSEADQRASAALADRVPERPKPLSPAERVRANPRSPYEKLAVDLYEQVERGERTAGSELPPMKRLAVDYAVSIGTVHRAIQLLQEWGTVEVAQGKRAKVSQRQSAEVKASEPSEQTLATPDENRSNSEMLEFDVRRGGRTIQTFSAEADPSNAAHLRMLLTAAVRRDGREPGEILDYEMEVRRPEGTVIKTFVTMPA
ncbi:GntR family transcriptional regulator [Saccharopolyspora aridisoli]|uniref:GntR family transcriptional regulator n=1 Tax=Saccharopolyspora aridisoli TaxID=2530385 RepID=A0A4R4U9G3_9PSEU|nr:tyrosine-type recombinase/integrase [Saccharopolyspora aridisoli]TDC88148.1 GntR family transcriptional regulator [Saccharopolyspora aridisoli]